MSRQSKRKKYLGVNQRSLDQEQLRKKSKKVAAILKILAHPQRLMIVCCLIEGEKSVSQIESSCGASQSAVSQFLKSMRSNKLLLSRREGKQVYYGISDSRVVVLIQSLSSIFCY